MKRGFFLLLMTSATLVGCSMDKSTLMISKNHVTYDPQYKEELVVYKKNALPYTANSGLETQKDIELVQKPKNDQEKILDLFNFMKEQSTDGKTVPIIPKDVQLLGASLVNGKITLDFNNNVHNLPDKETERLFIKTINDTMTLNFIQVDQVIYQVNGAPVGKLTFTNVPQSFVIR